MEEDCAQRRGVLKRRRQDRYRDQDRKQSAKLPKTHGRQIIGTSQCSLLQTSIQPNLALFHLKIVLETNKADSSYKAVR
jgi:hypothetical protein